MDRVHGAPVLMIHGFGFSAKSIAIASQKVVPESSSGWRGDGASSRTVAVGLRDCADERAVPRTSLAPNAGQRSGFRNLEEQNSLPLLVH
jgi:hypothetical protein